MTNGVLDAFLDMMRQFLDALEETFPECFKVKTYKLGLTVRLAQCANDEEALREVARQCIGSYHDSMVAYYGRCSEQDESLIHENIDLMLNIDLHQKWTPELHPDTKAAIWEYINKLNEYSNIYAMYAQVPRGMMGSIENIAHSLATRISSGQMSLSDLNLQDMSEQVMSSIDPNDLQQFAATLQNGNMMQSVTNMYSMVSSMMRSQNM
jgi:hypothetical protein